MTKMLEEMVPEAELVDDEVEEEIEMVKDVKGNVISLTGDVKQLDVVPAFALTMDQVRERIQMLQQFIQEYMIPGQDFGVIPGCKKPSLLKAGAEKLTDVYGLSKRAEITNRMEDWEKGLFSYEVKVTLINKRTGLIEAEGLGSCNNREKKYSSQNPYNLPNTLLKMAKKRSLVDAVLSATRSSGIFTQDMEDINDFANTGATVITTEAIPPASEEQLKEIYSLAQEIGLTPRVAKQLIKSSYKVDDSRLLSSEQAEDFIKKLNKMMNGGK